MKILIVILLTFSFTSNCQSIVGAWKRTSAILEYNNGKLYDSQKSSLNTLPCAADIQYVFEKTGKHFLILPKGCENVPNEEATWQIIGNTFSISQRTTEGFIDVTYELGFEGNMLTMTHVYSPAENIPNVKKLILRYQRL